MKNKVGKKRRKALKKELKLFEKTNAATPKERKALRKWVAKGNSVYTNEFTWGTGDKRDYLTFYRFQQDMENTGLPPLKSAPEDTEPAEKPRVSQAQAELDAMDFVSFEKLREISVRIYRTCQLLWEVIIENDLRDDALFYMEEYGDCDFPFTPFDLIFAPDDLE